MKKFRGVICGLISAAMVLSTVCVVSPKEVGAENIDYGYANKTNLNDKLRVTDLGTDYAVIEWDEIDEDEGGYKVTLNTDGSVKEFFFDKEVRKYKFSGLKCGTSYWVILNNETEESSKDYYHVKFTTGLTSSSEAIRAKIINKNTATWEDPKLSFDVYYNNPLGVYTMRSYTMDGKLFSSVDKIGDSYTRYQEGVSVPKNQPCYITAATFTFFNDKRFYSPESSKFYYVRQPEITSVKNDGKTIKVKWKKTKYATSYDIYAARGEGKGKLKSKYYKVGSVSGKKSSFTIKKVGGKKVNKKSIYLLCVNVNCNYKGIKVSSNAGTRSNDFKEMICETKKGKKTVVYAQGSEAFKRRIGTLKK